jgi:hypothetical protein
MFPNLREIELFDISAGEKTSYLNNPFQFTRATSKLEKIEDSRECELTSQLAMFNMYSNLKSLDLVITSKNNFNFSQLKNMPVLETLTLQYFRLQLMDLEMVHHNMPLIKILSLKAIYIVSGEIP